MRRPKTRGDCVNGPRPCPWVSCRHHMYLEVNDATGGVKVNPTLGIEAGVDTDVEAETVMNMPQTCSLDVADRGPHLLEEVASNLGLVRERIRQIETKGLAQLAFFMAFRGLKNPDERAESERFLREGAWTGDEFGRVLQFDRADIIARMEAITKRIDAQGVAA